MNTWNLEAPIYQAQPYSKLRSHACKDPSIVRHEGRWHLFTTVRDRRQPKPYIEYTAFGDWGHANQAPRHRLLPDIAKLSAPQIFFYRPWMTWMLVFQMNIDGCSPWLQPVYCTNPNINDPTAWSDPRALFKDKPQLDTQGWIDFWLIGDGKLMYLFYTGCNGFMAMSTCSYTDFPHGFTSGKTVLRQRGKDWHLFEAAHIYKLQNCPWYVAIVEGLQWSNPGGMRFFQLYACCNLNEGRWTSIQVSPDQAFAHISQCQQSNYWSENISHGECIRLGNDERLEISDTHTQMIIQGADSNEYQNSYIDIPWKLGLLKRNDNKTLSELIEAQL